LWFFRLAMAHLYWSGEGLRESVTDSEVDLARAELAAREFFVVPTASVASTG